jgi:hypothetical protein
MLERLDVIERQSPDRGQSVRKAYTRWLRRACWLVAGVLAVTLWLLRAGNRANLTAGTLKFIRFVYILAIITIVILAIDRIFRAKRSRGRFDRRRQSGLRHLPPAARRLNLFAEVPLPRGLLRTLLKNDSR